MLMELLSLHPQGFLTLEDVKVFLRNHVTNFNYDCDLIKRCARLASRVTHFRIPACARAPRIQRV